jgi:hypothetical protein
MEMLIAMVCPCRAGQSLVGWGAGIRLIRRKRISRIDGHAQRPRLGAVSRIGRKTSVLPDQIRPHGLGPK